MPEDGAQITGVLTIVVRGPDGEVKEEREIDNLVTSVGKAGVADQLLDSPAVNVPSHMGVGTGTTAADVADTALQSELSPRNAFTSKTRSGAVVTMVASWSAGQATGSITEAGIFNAASTGDLYNRAVFTAIPKGAGDSLSISWAVTVN